MILGSGLNIELCRSCSFELTSAQSVLLWGLLNHLLFLSACLSFNLFYTPVYVRVPLQGKAAWLEVQVWSDGRDEEGVAIHHDEEYEVRKYRGGREQRLLGTTTTS